MPPLDGDGDGWVTCDLPLSPARPACDCQPTEPTLYPGASCFTGLPGVCSAGSYDCSIGPGSCSQTIFPTPEVCDGLDNNCNGAIDEGNPGGGAPCSTGLPGICDNGTTTCSGGSIMCQQTTLPQVETCNDGLDNDCDGLVDCTDPDCFLDPACVGVENCGNGIDDDGDTLVDCADPDCFLDPLCTGGVEDCTNGIDDDGDFLVDCADPDCSFDPACTSGPEDCSDGVDNDGDGLVDCADPDCQALSCGAGCICAYGVSQETDCTNGIDDDGDGLGDCADPMCAALPICGGGAEICDNGLDDDGDGFIDCVDGACQLNPACIPWENPGSGTPGLLCNTWDPDPACALGRTAQVTLTCKPLTLSCY